MSKSALARANELVTADFYKDLFGASYARLQATHVVPGKPFRFKGKLFSLDGSLIDLSMKVFPWADVAPKKAAFKLHLGLDHDGLIPAFAEVHRETVCRCCMLRQPTIKAVHPLIYTQ